MPVNLTALDPALLNAVPGLRIATVMAGGRKTNRRDLVLFALEEGAAVAGVFTTNRFCAAPVQICQRQLAAGHAVRALLVNTGNANAGTGADGLARAERSCSALAAELGLHAQQVLPLLHRRHHGDAAGGTHRGRPDRARRRAAARRRRRLGRSGARHHDHRHAAQGGVAPGADRRSHGHRHGHQQGRRHDPPEHGHHAGLHGHRRRDRTHPNWADRAQQHT